MRVSGSGLLPLMLAAALSGAPRAARADATAEQRTVAQALFDDARKLMANQKYAEACTKLEESQRLDPGMGTLLNLAECQALTGRTATSWTNFLEVAYQAKAARQAKRESTARSRAAALEPKLSRLTILAVTARPGLEIRRDGVVVGPSLLGTAVPVDPGEHVVTAKAPGRKPWETRVTVRPDAQPISVSVPPLEDAAPVVPAPPPSGSSGARLAGIVLAGVGGAGLVAGAVMGGVIASKHASLVGSCGPSLQCDPALRSDVDAYNALRVPATVVLVAGSVLATAGIVVLAAGPPGDRRAAEISLSPTGIAIRGVY